MIFLSTGVPGAGKTLNTIKFVTEDKQFQDRPVYYHNIRDCNLPEWNELTDEQAQKWYELPKGSVVILDECQELFPVAGPRKSAPPEYIEKLAVHRHLGIDLVLITQEPRNINAFARRLVSMHRHYVRHFGTERLKIFEWHNKCAEDVHDYHTKLEANVTQTKLDKKYFGSYHSAEVHTQQARFPWVKMGAIVGIPAICIALSIYFLASHFMGMAGGDDVVTSGSSESVPHFRPITQTFANYGDKPEMSQEDWAARLTPRVAGLPQTAPVYDKLREPKTYPKLVCGYMQSRDSCKCITQQGTKVDVEYQLCRDIVQNGIFDYAKEDDINRRGGRPTQEGSIPPVRHNADKGQESSLVWAGASL